MYLQNCFPFSRRISSSFNKYQIIVFHENYSLFVHLRSFSMTKWCEHLWHNVIYSKSDSFVVDITNFNFLRLWGCIIECEENEIKYGDLYLYDWSDVILWLRWQLWRHTFSVGSSYTLNNSNTDWNLSFSLSIFSCWDICVVLSYKSDVSKLSRGNYLVVLE